MSNTSSSKCPFEHIANPEQEALQIAETAALTIKLLGKRYPPPQPVLRGVHPKSHGCVSATFTIDPGIPTDLRVGLFATPGKQFRAVIRFSNAAAVVAPDTDKGGRQDSRGMAVKVLDVDGDVLDEDGGAHNQDFLMINQPVFAFANTEDYVRLTRVLDRDNDVLDGFFRPTPEDGITPEAAGRIPETVAVVGQIQSMLVGNPLGARYFSAAPFLFGPNRVMKFSARPCQVVPPTNIPDPLTDNYLGDALTGTMLQQGSLRFDFMVQVRGADADLGVENASSLWDEVAHPFVKVAEITIATPQPEIATPAHQARCERLVFTPWHSLIAHQPIGSINRLRRSVYQASAERRGTGLVNGDPGLLFYDAAAGEIRCFSTDGKGAITLIGAGQTGLRKTWSRIVPGNFGPGSTTDLLFYDAAAGEIRFFSTDGKGTITLIGTGPTSLRKTWTHIVPGNFGPGSTTDLLFYDAAAGEIRIFSTDGKGTITLIGSGQTGLRKTWSHIVPGHFGPGATTGLYCYDAAAGEGRFFSTDGSGTITAVGSVQTGLRRTWSHIVPGHFGPGATTGLYCYDAAAGEGRFFSTDGSGTLTAAGSLQTGLRKTWSHIVPGSFGGGTTTGLYCLHAGAGEGRFFSTDGSGALTAVGSLQTGMRKTWSRVVAGSFLPG